MKTCPVCNNEFTDPKHKNKIYCSNKCKGIAQRTRKHSIRVCIQCGKEFYNQRYPDRVFCGKQCFLKSRTIEATQRKCAICHTTKPISQFAKSNASLIGISSICETCANQKNKLTKTCSKCKQTFPRSTEYFHFVNTESSWHSWCKACLKIENQKSYRKHRDERLEQKRRYSANNTEVIQQRNRDQYAKNREKRLQYEKEKNTTDARRESRKRYRQTHRNEIRQMNRRAEQKRRTKRIFYYQTRKANERNLATNFSPAEWQRCLDYWNNCCAYCGKPKGLRQTLAQDHYVPLSKGGPYIAQNILPACHGEDGCNNSKHNKDVVKWLVGKFGNREAEIVLDKIQTYFVWVASHTATSSEIGSDVIAG